MPARVLIIEDNPANLELVRYLLESRGYTALTAVDGEQGLRIFRAAHPDIVLCDLQLPTLDGFEVLSRIRDEPGHTATPVIAVTALSMPTDRAAALAAGFNDYLPKPIEPSSFVEQVEAFIRPELRASGSSADA
jgi:two-component system, cell cycle response regulator DivK